MVDLPFEDRADFEDADRGLIGALDPGVVKMPPAGGLGQRRVRFPAGYPGPRVRDRHSVTAHARVTSEHPGGLSPLRAGTVASASGAALRR